MTDAANWPTRTGSDHAEKATVSDREAPPTRPPRPATSGAGG
jgi:hypothetical protein